MKLTDIDLSSLAEVAAALKLLESVHVRLATGGTPLPSLPPAEFVVNPAQPAVEQPLPASGISMIDGPSVALTAADFGFPKAAIAADAEKLRGLGVDPLTGIDLMDAASVFGGAPAQSAAPLPALSTAAAAPSPTVPVAPPASGLLSLASSAPTAPAPRPGAWAAAPTVPAAPESPAGGVELDADGLPWDERIHAGTKRKNADGRWTAKRGINDPDFVPRVVAQLRAQMVAGGATAQSATPLAPPGSLGAALGVPQMTLAQLQEATAPAHHVTAAPVDALKALASLPAVTGGKPTPTTFADFMTAATVEVQGGRLTAMAFGEACKPYGGPAGLASNPSAIPTVWGALKAQHPGML